MKMIDDKLSHEEKVRYSRHFNLPHFSIDEQLQLKRTKVLVIGAGGLGIPLLQYLTAIGIGKIGIVDFDRIELSNLQRQVLFDHGDIGHWKTKTVIAKLRKQNPNVCFVDHRCRIESSNAMELIAQYDIIADGTDNFQTRYLINDACVLGSKAYVYASIFQYEGQLTVFNKALGNRLRGPNYRDLFPTPPSQGRVWDCADGGVLGVLPGIVGSMQALEVVKLILGIGEGLSGRLLLFDALSFTVRTLQISKDPKNPLTGDKPTQNTLIDYHQFCNAPITTDLKSISVAQLKIWMEEGRDFQLIDVREAYEYKFSNLNGTSMPMGAVEKRINEIEQQKDVVLVCKSGNRSADTASLLKQKFGFSNIYHLNGGLLLWKEKIDKHLIIA